MADDKEYKDVTSENTLEDLLKLVLKGCDEDIKEANENIALYLEEIGKNPLAKEMFGSLLNDSIKIKGQARDRFMKAVTMIANRIKTKEFITKAAGASPDYFSPENLVKSIESLRTKKLQRDIEDDDNEPDSGERI